MKQFMLKLSRWRSGVYQGIWLVVAALFIVTLHAGVAAADATLAEGLDTPGRIWTVVNTGYGIPTDWAYQANPSAHDGVDSAGVDLLNISNGIPWTDPVSSMYTTVNGAATVTFWTSGFTTNNSSCYSGFDLGGKKPVIVTTDGRGWTQWLVSQTTATATDLYFYCHSWCDVSCAVDQVQVLPLQSHTVTTTVTNGALTPAGPQNVVAGEKASFSINAPLPGYAFGSISGCGGTRSGTNFVTSPILNDCTITATYVPTSPGYAVDNPNLAWVTTPDAPWSYQIAVTHDGTNAARSGSIADNGTSWLETTVTGPALVRFWWKVSSEEAHDFLRVVVDGVVTPGGSISGEVDWRQETIAVTAGTHAVRWSYVKDGSAARGSDTAWLDQVAILPIDVTATVTATVGTGGTTSPASQSIQKGTKAELTITPDTGFAISAVSGCGGTLSGATYTTAGITGDCSVIASFIPATVSGRMVRSRLNHTATMLPDGKVLLVGGGAADAEIYDAATNSSTLKGTLLVNRTGHTETLLPDGKVLIAGGGTRTAELYDPATGAFTLIGSLNSLRSGHTATLLQNGKVLLAGGGVNTAELYDPTGGAFTPTGNMPDARRDHHAELLANGKVILAGGDDYGTWRSLLYDPATGGFQADASSMQGGSGATRIQTGSKVDQTLLAGGLSSTSYCSSFYDSYGWYTCDGYTSVYDTITNGFRFDPATAKTLPTNGGMVTGRGRYSSVSLLDGKILVTGGKGTGAKELMTLYDNHNPDGYYVAVEGMFALGLTNLDSVEIYDPTTDQFSSATAMTVPRSGHTATLLPSGKVLLAGGANGAADSSIQLYDAGVITTPKFSLSGVVSDARTGALLDGVIVAVTPLSVTTGADGGFSLDLPGTGSYTMTASKAGYVTQSFTITLTTDIPAVNQPVVLIPVEATVTVSLSGAGSGAINGGNPGGIACSWSPQEGVCSALFPVNAQITLSAIVTSPAVFGGWGGACSGCSGLTCLYTVPTVGGNCSARFDLSRNVHIVNTLLYFDTLLQAYAAAGNTETIAAQRVILDENLLLDTVGKSVTIKGGYEPTFTTQTGYTTILKKLTIGKGGLVADRVIIN